MSTIKKKFSGSGFFHRKRNQNNDEDNDNADPDTISIDSGFGSMASAGSHTDLLNSEDLDNEFADSLNNTLTESMEDLGIETMKRSLSNITLHVSEDGMNEKLVTQQDTEGNNVKECQDEFQFQQNLRLMEDILNRPSEPCQDNSKKQKADLPSSPQIQKSQKPRLRLRKKRRNRNRRKLNVEKMRNETIWEQDEESMEDTSSNDERPAIDEESIEQTNGDDKTPDMRDNDVCEPEEKEEIFFHYDPYKDSSSYAYRHEEWRKKFNQEEDDKVTSDDSTQEESSDGDCTQSCSSTSSSSEEEEEHQQNEDEGSSSDIQSSSAEDNRDPDVQDEESLDKALEKNFTINIPPGAASDLGIVIRKIKINDNIFLNTIMEILPNSRSSKAPELKVKFFKEKMILLSWS